MYFQGKAYFSLWLYIHALLAQVNDLFVLWLFVRSLTGRAHCRCLRRSNWALRLWTSLFGSAVLLRIDRLGANGAGEIKSHPFFAQVDFSSNLRQQPAPYRPKIAHPMDTSNFDPVEEEGGPGAWSNSGDSTRTLDLLCSPQGKHPEHAFYEFTFRRFFDDNGCPFRYPKPLESSDMSTGSTGATSTSPQEVQEQEEQEEEQEEEEEGEQGEGCEPVYVWQVS